MKLKELSVLQEKARSLPVLPTVREGRRSPVSDPFRAQKQLWFSERVVRSGAKPQAREKLREAEGGEGAPGKATGRRTVPTARPALRIGREGVRVQTRPSAPAAPPSDSAFPHGEGTHPQFSRFGDTALGIDLGSTANQYKHLEGSWKNTKESSRRDGRGAEVGIPASPLPRCRAMRRASLYCRVGALALGKSQTPLL